MKFLKSLFFRFHLFISRKSERGSFSSGYIPPRVRQATKNLILKKVPRINLLEVGCGEGLFLESLAQDCPKLNIVGIDNFSENLNEARMRKHKAGLENVSIIMADARALSLKDNYFDTVVCINMFYNLSSKEEIARVIKEMIRVCKREGRIIFDLRNKLNPLIYLGYKFKTFYDSTSIPVKAYSLKEISRLLKEQSLSIREKILIGFPLSILALGVVIETRLTGEE